MKKLDRKWYGLLGFAIFVAFVLSITNAGASPADCSASSALTGTLSQSGNMITGTADNCSDSDADVGLVVIAAFQLDDGTIQNREHNRVTGTVAAGQSLDLVSDAPECTIKVILYKGSNENDQANKLAQSVYNVDKDNYCSDKPTPTPPPPTDTPPPPTKTPPPPTKTPPPPTKTPPPPTETPPPAGQGCTPGYWRQDHHFDSWTTYSPSDSYDATFGVDGSFATLLDAVWARGGGENALARHAVAALLNAASPGVDYLYTEADVISMVQSAYASGDFEGIKNLFAAENEMGCTLN